MLAAILLSAVTAGPVPPVAEAYVAATFRTFPSRATEAGLHDFDEALAFTKQVAKLADKENHHPDLLTGWGKVRATWWTHKIKGLSMNDFIMAAKTDRLSKAGT